LPLAGRKAVGGGSPGHFGGPTRVGRRLPGAFWRSKVGRSAAPRGILAVQSESVGGSPEHFGGPKRTGDAVAYPLTRASQPARVGRHHTLAGREPPVRLTQAFWRAVNHRSAGDSRPMTDLAAARVARRDTLAGLRSNCAGSPEHFGGRWGTKRRFPGAFWRALGHQARVPRRILAGSYGLGAGLPEHFCGLFGAMQGLTGLLWRGLGSRVGLLGPAWAGRLL